MADGSGPINGLGVSGPVVDLDRTDWTYRDGRNIDPGDQATFQENLGIPGIGALIPGLSSLEAAFISTPQLYNATTNNVVTTPMIMAGAGVITVDGITLTINGSFSAPPKTVFVGLNGGNVVFGPGSLSEGAVDPRWFGLQTCAPGTVQGAGQMTANVNAFNNANLALNGLPGFVDVRWNAWACFNGPLRCGLANGQGVVGMGAQATQLYFPNYHGPMVYQGSQAATPQNDRCFISGVTVQRGATANADQTVFRQSLGDVTLRSSTNSSPPTTTQIAGMDIGLVAMGLASPFYQDARFNDNMVGVYTKWTTQASGELLCALNSYAGGPSDIRCGVYFECRGVAPAGTSMNGSWQVKDVLCLRGAFGGVFYGIIADGRPSTAATGGDIRDIRMMTPEFGGCSYGALIMSSGTLDSDIKFIGASIDTTYVTGLFCYGLSPGSSVRFTNGHFNMSGTGGCQCVVVDTCARGPDVEGEFDGGANYANTTVLATNGNVKGMSIRGSVVNCAYGIVLNSGATGNDIGPLNYGSFSGQGGQQLVVLNTGANSNYINGCINNGVLAQNIIAIAGNNNIYRTPINNGTVGQAVNIIGTGNTVG